MAFAAVSSVLNQIDKTYKKPFWRKFVNTDGIRLTYMIGLVSVCWEILITFWQISSMLNKFDRLLS